MSQTQIYDVFKKPVIWLLVLSDNNDYLYRKKGISDFEYQFYRSIYRKKILSAKQWEIKERINRKFLNFTSYETNSHFNKINKVLKWAQNNSFFNTDFVLSLKKSCQQKGRLTENQLSALNSHSLK